MAVRNMKTCVYVSDDNLSYLKRLDSRYQAQDDGGSPAELLLGADIATTTQLRTLPNVPRDLKPRHVILETSDGAFTARMPVFTPAAYIALQGANTINFFDGGGTSHTGVVVGHEGEHSLHKRDIS